MQNCDDTTLVNNPFFHEQRLRRLRRERGLSVHLLADQTGLCVRQIWRMEAGHRPNVRAITVARISLALNTSVDYLLGLTEEPAPYRKSSACRTPPIEPADG